MAALFKMGANFYECGDAFKKYATMAYLMESPIIEWSLACLSVVWTAALCIVLRWFLPVSSVVRREEQRQRVPTSERPTEVKTKSRTVTTCWFFFYLTCWIIGLAGLGAAYLSTYALPHPNIFDGHGIVDYILPYVNGFLALYLSVVTSFLIPFVTKPTVRAVLGDASDEAAIREWESIFAMVARTLGKLISKFLAVLPRC